ncbi:MAG: efflux RND transporter permease subunit [Propionibacteriaceae bacterium]
MTFLTKISLANRLIVGLITLAIIGFGVSAIFSLKQELLPSITAPTAIVNAVFPGSTPQIVAKEVATPIEQSVKAVSGVTKVNSTSTNGNATVTVEWEYGLDSDKIVSDVRNAVDSIASTLPESVETDVLTGSTDDIPVLQLAVASDGSLSKTGELVDSVAVPELSGIDGVRQVILSGENTTQLGVTLRPKDLRKNDLTAQAVTQSIQAQAIVTPAGNSFDGNTELAIEVGSSLDSVKQVQAIPIATTDGPVTLGELADVKVEAVESTSVARADGRPALSVAVMKDTAADAVEISHAVNAMIPDLEKRLGSNTTFTTVFDQAPLIEQSIHDLAVEGGLGLVFAVLIILLFLFSVRSTIITAISIPLSLLIAMIGLQLGEYSLNIFTLAALTVAVGRVVDDSIVVIENIKRHAIGHQTLTPADIIASVKEVAGAVTASTITTVAVFLPVAVVSGVVGELFKPFAITVAIALTASLFVSMTIVPVLAYWFLSRGSRKQQAAAAAGDVGQDEENKVTRLQRGYLPVLNLGLRHPIFTLAIALVIFVGTLGSATLLKTDFLGSIADDSTLSIEQKLPAGTRLSATSAAAQKTEKVLADTPEVKGYLTTIGGTAIPGVGGGGANVAAITVTLPDGANADAVRQDLQTKMDAVKGAGEITVSAQNTGATNTDVSVIVTGEKSTDLRVGAERIEQLLGTVDGLTDIRSDLSEQRKVLKVSVDRTEAAKQGFTQAEIGTAVSNALNGTQVGSVTLEGETRDIFVHSEAARDPSPSDIANLELPVSQIQQQKATEKATDKVTDKQKKAQKKGEKEADEAAEDQRQALLDSREEARDGLSDLRAQLRKLKNSPPKAPKVPKAAAPANPAANPNAANPNAANPNAANPSAPNPGAVNPNAVPSAGATPSPGATPGPSASQPPVDPPVTQAQLAASLAAQQAALAAALTQTAAQQQYAAQVQQYAQQVGQLTASVEQTEKSIDQINDQIDAANEQSEKSIQQREDAEELTDEQEAIADVRAKPLQVKDVAKVEQVSAPTTVTQIDGKESVTILATPSGSDLGALSATIQQKLDTVPDLPTGVVATLGGASQDQQDAFRQLGLAMLVAIALVFIVMVATFRSLVQPLILLISIPFAATGAIAGLLITDTPLGVPAMVGLLMLIGIVVTNAIVLIDLINQYRARGEDVTSAVVDGARLRLRPIIMTACATIGALIPMGLGLTGGGAFISQPLAVVVIGGLVSSTILTLLLVPVLYTLIERRGERRELRRQRRDAALAAEAEDAEAAPAG